MDDDLFTLLSSAKVFSSAPKRAIRKLIPHFEKIELSLGETLYYQGDPSDSIELMMSGKLESILTTAEGDCKTVGEIAPGEMVGELGALSGQPRSTTIKAAKDSTLFKLPSQLFVEFCHLYPSVLLSIINPIVTRSHQLLELVSSEKFKKYIAILPANEEVSLSLFEEQLKKEMAAFPYLILLSDNTLSDTSSQAFQKILDEARAKNVKKIKQRFIFLLNAKDSPLATFCLNKIDMVYIVGDDHAPTVLNAFVLNTLLSLKSKTKVKAELILLHKPDVKIPTGTAKWLTLFEFGLCHHLRLEAANDFRRLLRFIRNKAIGVVLGGGGTRGWAHAGALSALREAGIPIDAIGGTSVGAVVAASYAMTESPEETLAQFSHIMDKARNSVAWRNLTWPAISLFNAKGLTHVLEHTFKTIRIEDLWLPYFCISSNLAKNAETVHDRGLLWKKTRASIAIPGVIPPMILEQELHFDGGLLNNLPVDVMRKTVGHRGTIIAVELDTQAKELKYHFPPILTFWDTLASILHIGPHHYRFPRFIDTFLKSLLIGSALKSQQNSMAANLLIMLDMNGFPMLHSNKTKEKRLVEIGFDTTMDKIKHQNLRVK